MKKFIYLAAYKANHPNHNVIYQDINGKRDIGGDMLDVDLSKYDAIIATPPCNYYSRCNYRRETSSYAQKTKHLLPDILKKLCNQNKPFIVENVRNYKIFLEMNLYDLPCLVYTIGRHTYWTNILMTTDFEQRYDFKSRGIRIKYKDQYGKNHQGGYNVHQVIENWIEQVELL